MIKIFLIIIKNIVDMMRNQTRIFIIIMVSLIAVSASMLFLSGVILLQKNIFDDEFVECQKKYSIALSDEASNKNHDLIKELAEKAKDLNIKSIEVVGKYENENDEITVKGVTQPIAENYILRGENFDNGDFIGTNNIAILSDDLSSLNTNQNKEVYVFENYEYQIIGITDILHKQIILPLSIYIEHKYIAQNIFIQFKVIPDSSSLELLKTIVLESETNAEIINPVKNNSDMLQLYIFYGFIMIIIVIFAISNITSLFRFWASENAFQFSIYSLCGAKNTYVHIIVLLQALLIGIISFVSGYIIYNIVYTSIQEMYTICKISGNTILFTFVLYLLSIYVGVGKIAKNSSNENKILEVLSNGGVR